MSHLANITDFWLRMPKTTRSLFRLFLPTSKEENSRKCHLVFHFSRSNCGASERNVLATGEKAPNIFRPLSEIGSPDPGNCNRKKSRPNTYTPKTASVGKHVEASFPSNPGEIFALAKVLRKIRKGVTYLPQKATGSPIEMAKYS